MRPQHLLCLLALGTLRACAAGADAPPTLREVARIDLPGVSGRLDHLAIDRAGGRLFLAALGNGTLEVIDLKAGRRIASVEGFSEPQGVAFLPGPGQVVVTNGGGSSAAILDGKTFETVATVRLRADPDNVRVEAGTGTVWVGEGTGTHGALGRIDPAQGSVVCEIEVGGHPESFQLEEKGTRAFVNVPGAAQVVVVDRAQGRVTARWALPDARSNFPMAFDEAHGRLLVGCRHPAVLLVLDTATGEVVQRLDAPGDADDVFVDAAADRVYVTGGGGAIHALARDAEGRYAPAGEVEAPAGARTSLFVPETGRLYLAVPRRGDHDAQVVVYATRPE